MKDNTTSIIPNESIKSRKAPGILSTIAKDAVLKQLQQLRYGQLTIDDHGEHYYFGNETDEFPVTAVMTSTMPTNEMICVSG